MLYWAPGSFTWRARVQRLGVAGRGDVYQILETIEPKSPRQGPGGQMQLLLAERKPGDFCLIYDGENFFKLLFQMGPAKLLRVDGRPVLVTTNAVAGNDGGVYSRVWTFPDGIPLGTTFFAIVARAMPAMLRLAPAGCTDTAPHFRQRPGGLQRTYRLWFWKEDADRGMPNCGSVVARLGMRSGRLEFGHFRYSGSPYPGRP